MATARYTSVHELLGTANPVLPPVPQRCAVVYPLNADGTDELGVNQQSFFVVMSAVRVLCDSRQTIAH